MQTPSARTTTLTSTPSIIPIILGGGSNLHLWPTSRINMPIQFQKKSNQPSLFEQVLSGIALLNHSLPPIITLPSAAHETGQRQLADFPLLPKSQILVEPMDRGSLHAATLCALLAAQTDRSALMVIIDASNPPTDWQAFSRLIQQTKESPLAREKIIVCGQPETNNGISLHPVNKNAATEDNLLFSMQTINDEPKGQVFNIGQVFFATPRVFLEKIGKLCPQALSSCSKALQLAEQHNFHLWPDLNLWSAQPSLSLANLLKENPKSALLRPVDLMSPKTPTPPSRHILEHKTLNCYIQSDGHLLAVVGCENLHITATRDATLVAEKNSLDSLETILDRLRVYERPEVFDFPECHFPWGLQTQLDNNSNYTILRLEIEQGAQLPAHLHNHRTENWLVLEGRGEAVIDNQIHSLNPGVSIELPQNILHTCRNMGHEKLIILETRYGPAISNSDIVFFEQFLQKEMV